MHIKSQFFFFSWGIHTWNLYLIVHSSHTVVYIVKFLNSYECSHYAPCVIGSTFEWAQTVRVCPCSWCSEEAWGESSVVAWCSFILSCYWRRHWACVRACWGWGQRWRLPCWGVMRPRPACNQAHGSQPPLHTPPPTSYHFTIAPSRTSNEPRPQSYQPLCPIISTPSGKQ